MQFVSNLSIQKESNLPIFEKNLSICFHANGFSFSITAKKDKTLISIADYEWSFPDTLSEQMVIFKAIFAENNIHSFGFNSINIVFPTIKHVWIPEELFSEEHKSNFLKSVVKVDFTETVCSCLVPEIKAFSVFSIPQTLYASLKILIPSALFESQHTALLKKMLDFEKSEYPTLLVNVRKQEADILVLHKGTFLLSNTFYIQNKDDLLYLCLNVLRQLEFKEINTICHLAGSDIDELCLSSFRKLIPKTNCISLNITSEESKVQNYFILL